LSHPGPLAHGQWFSPGTPASSTTKTGRHDIAEILLKVALKHQKSINQSINQSINSLNGPLKRLWYYFVDQKYTKETRCPKVSKRSLSLIFFFETIGSIRRGELFIGWSSTKLWSSGLKKED
jgi:hypothetical protein